MKKRFFSCGKNVLTLEKLYLLNTEIMYRESIGEVVLGANFGNQDLVRFERNATNNLKELISIGDDVWPGLMLSLFYYFCSQYQNNLFHYGKLDPAEFAKEFGFEERSLKSHHPHPAQLAGKTDEEISELYRREEEFKKRSGVCEISDRVWDSCLENALYVYLTKPLCTFLGGAYNDFKKKDGVIIKASAAMNIIDKLWAYYDGKKIVYGYTLNPNFQLNLTHYFLEADKKSLLALTSCTSRLEPLYFYLCNLRSVFFSKGLNHSEFVSEESSGALFEKLCDLADISVKLEPRRRKENLNRKLSQINSLTDLKISIEWQTIPGARGAYYPVLYFGDRRDSHLSFSKSHQNHQRNGLKKSVFHENFIREFVDVFRFAMHMSVIDDYSNEIFKDWLFDNTVNEKEKRYALERTYYKTELSIPDDLQRRQNAFFMGIRSFIDKDVNKLIEFTYGLV